MVKNSNPEMDKSAGTNDAVLLSCNNIRPASICPAAAHTSLLVEGDTPSTSASEVADQSLGDGSDVASANQVTKTELSASPSSGKCLGVKSGEKGNEKQGGKSTKLDKPVVAACQPVITKGGKKVVISADGVAVPEKPELLSIPQTNFAIGLLVTCCFNPPFGLLALYFSLTAAAAYRDGNKAKGARYARSSIVVSLLGIMLTMVIISSVVLYIAVNKHSARRGQRRMNSSSLGF